MNDSGAKTLLAGSPFLFRKVLKIANNCPNLQRIIPVFDDYQKYLPDSELNVGVISLKSLIEEGEKTLNQYQKKIEIAREAILPSDLTSLIYTSGTTGTPKGVMLTHSNFVQNVKVCLEQIPVINKDDLFLSFLPLSHVFERTATYHVCCAVGSKIAFAQSLELLAKNMAEVKPTVMSCVPRLLERIHDKAMKNGTSAGGLKAKIFLSSIETGKEFREVHEAGKKPSLILGIKKSIAEKLVFSKIKEKTGGRLKFMLSGGAALPKNVGEFFGNLGIKVLEGFGLTETSPVLTASTFEKGGALLGTVGKAIPGVEIFIDPSDGNYRENEGEILASGPNIMMGYYNKPEATAAVTKVIDGKSWFCTGDVGKFIEGPEGGAFLKITDRKKELLKTSGGKYVAPAPIENKFKESFLIEQMMVVGDSPKCVSALIVPAEEALRDWCGNNGLSWTNLSDMVQKTEIIDLYQSIIDEMNKEFAHIDQVKKFKLLTDPWEPVKKDGTESELTPTMKLKRRVILDKYSEEIQQIYKD